MYKRQVFDLCNDLQYGLWASTAMLPFLFVSVFRRTYYSFLDIPLEIYKVYFQLVLGIGCRNAGLLHQRFDIMRRGDSHALCTVGIEMCIRDSLI